MKLFSKSVAIVAAVVGLFLGTSAGYAVVITAVGIDTTTEADWRTTTTVKPLDGDADNVYGTAGYYTFAPGNHGDFTVAPFSPYDQHGLPSWLSVTADGATSYFSGGYSVIDNPTLAPGPSVADMNSGYAFINGITANTDTPLYQLTFGPGTPNNIFRIGLFDNSGGDPLKSFTLKSGASSATDTFGAVVSPNFVRYAFFDISGATNGDVITISGQISSVVGTGVLGLSGITVDVVPEPASMSLLAVGGLILIRRGRRVSQGI